MDALARLTAGLDRDEVIARAAFLPTMPDSDRWQFDAMQVRASDRDRCLVVKHTWPNEGAHIARQCPKATLDRVEAIRELERWHRDAQAEETAEASKPMHLRSEAPPESVTLGVVLRILAGIYTESAEEKS